MEEVLFLEGLQGDSRIQEENSENFLENPESFESKIADEVFDLESVKKENKISSVLQQLPVISEDNTSFGFTLAIFIFIIIAFTILCILRRKYKHE